MIAVAPPAARAFAVTLPMPELAPVARQIFSFIFPFSISHHWVCHLSLPGRVVGALWYMTNLRWKMENETTKAPPLVVRLGHGAVSHFDRPCQDNLFDSETFSAKPDLHRHAIQRGRAFDRQRDAY
jgi:hypothetical protein